MNKKFIITILLVFFIIPNIGHSQENMTVDSLLNSIKNPPPQYGPIFWPFEIIYGDLEGKYELGPNTIPLTLISNIDCNDVEILIDKIENIEVTSPHRFSINIQKNDTIMIYIDVIFHDTPTTRFMINLLCDQERKYRRFVDFLTLDNFYVPSTPETRDKFDKRNVISYSKKIGISDEELLAKWAKQDSLRKFMMENRYAWRRGENGEMEMVKMPDDTVKGDLKRMLELEKTPLTSADRQDIYVRRKFYTREYGETKFRPLVPDNPDTLIYRDSLLQYRKYHFVFKLESDKEIALVKNLVDTLLPMDSAGYYHGYIMKKDISTIDEHKILYDHYPNYPGIHTPSVSKKK